MKPTKADFNLICQGQAAHVKRKLGGVFHTSKNWINITLQACDYAVAQRPWEEIVECLNTHATAKALEKQTGSQTPAATAIGNNAGSNLLDKAIAAQRQDIFVKLVEWGFDPCFYHRTMENTEATTSFTLAQSYTPKAELPKLINEVLAKVATPDKRNELLLTILIRGNLHMVEKQPFATKWWDATRTFGEDTLNSLGAKPDKRIAFHNWLRDVAKLRIHNVAKTKERG